MNQYMNQYVPETPAETNPDDHSLYDGDAVKPWEDLSTLLALGDQAREEKDPSRAFAFYARATELEPNSARAWIGRAATTTNLHDAIECWAKALSFSPENDEAKSALGQRVEDKIVQSRLEDVGDLLNLGRILAEAGQKEFSHRLLVRATDLDNTNEEAWIWRAGVAKDTKEIVSCLHQALALNPANAQAQAGLQWAMSAEADTSAPRDSQAVEQAARLVEQAQQLLQSQDRVGAHGLFQKASELDRRNEEAWLWRGSTTTDIDEALTCMEQALIINSQNESAREARSWLRVKKLRERTETGPQDDALLRKATQTAPVDKPRAIPLLLLLVPIVIVLLGLAVLIWRLLL